MLDQVLSLFKIIPDLDLNIMVEAQTLYTISQKVLKGMENVLEREKPDLLTVQGDTTSAFIAAVAGFYKRIEIAHVEAGLRTYDKYQPFPEELNRRLISHLADINFAPTQMAKELLSRENVPGEIFVTGNTVVDALMMIARAKTIKARRGMSSEKKTILLTVHRRENFGRPLRNIFNAIRKIAMANSSLEIVYPVHPNPNVSKVAHHVLRGIKNIHLTKPLDYLSLVNIMADSYIILTDSGGIQEEAPAFGKPVLILREKTERPEAIKFKTAKLVGTDTGKIIIETERLLSSVTEYRKLVAKKNPFGDGKAAKRISAFLKRRYGFTRMNPQQFA
jgi:UDP-N-acetylglucosamine 2-epimerase (non-hydrolysing)